jgi:hypothetical protein
VKALRYTLQLVFAIGLPLLVQRWDRGRLTAEQRERAWNPASWGAALYGFNVFSMLGWCWVTRRGVRGVALGLLTTFVLLVAVSLLDYGVARALGISAIAPWDLG